MRAYLFRNMKLTPGGDCMIEPTVEIEVFTDFV